MRVLIVGNGGREVALAWRIAQSPILTALYATADSSGWPRVVKVRPTADVEEQVLLAAELRVDLVVVGPEAPLADGIADALEALNIPCFGPQMAAARLEASKSFAKTVMAEAGVKTADGLVADLSVPSDRVALIERLSKGNVVLKADGLAAGKGVFVCPSREEALAALQQLESGRFGAAAGQVVAEDLLTGPEVSLFALSDGQRVVPLLPCQDHKRLGDGDTGPNTGGMGAYAPCELLSSEEAEALVQSIHLPVIRAMAERGAPFRGVLYAGLMLTPDGPRVLEFNVRFGDPECQALMALWDEDILPWLYGAARGRLPSGRPHFRDGAAVVVVLASAGYPESSRKGDAILEPKLPHNVQVFHAAAHRDDLGVLRTFGGRVLGVTAVGDSLFDAVEAAYAQVPRCHFDGMQFRRDIAWQGLTAD